MSGNGGEGFNVAVVGATGLVGETMIAGLEERNFRVGSCSRWQRALLGKSVSFRDKRHSVATSRT